MGILGLAESREVIKAYVQECKVEGQDLEDIEQLFKDALKLKSISIHEYYIAMEEIYGEN